MSQYVPLERVRAPLRIFTHSRRIQKIGQGHEWYKGGIFTLKSTDMVRNKVITPEMWSKVVKDSMYSHMPWMWLKHDIDNYQDFMRFDIMPMFPEHEFVAARDYFTVFSICYWTCFCLELLNVENEYVYVEVRLVDKLMRYGMYDRGGFQGKNNRARMRMYNSVKWGKELGLLETNFKFVRNTKIGYDISDKVVKLTDRGYILVDKLIKEVSRLSNDDMFGGFLSKPLHRYFLNASLVNEDRRLSRERIMTSSKSRLKKHHVIKGKGSL